jgi:hypothetical protein
MNMHPHADTICEWSKKFPIEIWIREKGDKHWVLFEGKAPLWEKSRHYVLNDEYADLKKAYYDGKIIQTINKETVNLLWEDIEGEPKWDKHFTEYRIKPEQRHTSLEGFLKSKKLWDDFIERSKPENQRWTAKTFYYDNLNELAKNPQKMWIKAAFNWDYDIDIPWNDIDNEWVEIVEYSNSNLTFFEE